MTDSDDGPLIVLLSFGHTGPLANPEAFTPHSVVPYAGGWGEETKGSWCPACVAAGRAPERMGWREAWDEVERLRAADIRA